MGKKTTRTARVFLRELPTHARISIGITGDCPIPHLLSLLQGPKQGRVSFLVPLSFVDYPFRLEQGIDLFERNLNIRISMPSFLYFQAL